MKKFKLRISGGFVLAMALFWFFDVEGSLFPALVCALVHELGHLAALLISKGKPKGLNAAIWGLCIDYEGVHSRLQECFIILAGPLSNFVFALICFCFGNVSVFAISLVQGVFNLLPIGEMDGGRLLSMAVPSARFCRWAERISIAFVCSCAAFAWHYGKISGICLLSAWLIFDRVLAKARIKSYNK